MDRPAAAKQQSRTPSRRSPNSNDSQRAESSDGQPVRAAVFKGPKRKRLVKACDPCHKSKRRCDGTAPCSNCYFASKECTYTDSTGRPVPAPNALRPDIILSQPNAIAHSPTNINLSPPGVSSVSYPTPESHNAQLGTQPPEPPRSTSTDGSGASLLATNLSSESPAQPFRGEAPHGRGNLRLDLPADHLPPRKRPKNHLELSYRHDEPDRPLAGPSVVSRSPDVDLIGAEGTAYKRMDGTVTSSDFQKHVVHELVNLFFAHCHPHRLIIHSASFHADLCRGRIPPYLLNAVCAVAAPLSQNPLVRVTPVRRSGEKFADTALAALFDAEDHLLATSVEAAQALALVQTYIVYKDSSIRSDLRLYELALQILHSLHTLDTKSQALDTAPLSSDELYARAVQRESARRTFWLIHTVELLGAVFTQRPTMYDKNDLGGVRLPCDEASFDLALQVPPDRLEYLDAPALKTRDTSEFGHIIRIATILHDIERNNVDSPNPQVIMNCEQQLERWVIGLADHLRYNPENLQAHLSLWETGSNSSTWCYCFMHILHACAVLALSSVRSRLGQAACRDHESALQAFPTIIKALGPRARNSILMGSVLWVQYCGPHASKYNTTGTEFNEGYVRSNASAQTREGRVSSSMSSPWLVPQLDLWIKEWEEFWGPATIHRSSNAYEASMEERKSPYQQFHSATGSISNTGPPNTEEHKLLSATSPRSVPNVIINPVMRDDDDLVSTPPQQASPTLSNTSTLRSRNHPLLPSLKSSGLLDVLPDESLASRSSGASTPVKPHPSWSLGSVSPRPLLLSPGLPASAMSGSSGSAPVSPRPHSPGFQILHTPQVRLQAPSFYQANSPQPSSEIVAAPSLYEETETHPRTKFDSH